MRINEAYEHAPLLSCSLEEHTTGCGCDSCEKTGTQCVDIAAVLTVEPAAAIGTATVTCQGSPSVCCTADPEGRSCVVTLTQQVCFSVPVRYGVALTPGEATIACAGGDCREIR